MAGIGCDDKRVIQILAHRTQTQRLAIADAYYRQYGESIQKRLKNELHGKLEVAFITEPCFQGYEQCWESHICSEIK